MNKFGFPQGFYTDFCSVSPYAFIKNLFRFILYKFFCLQLVKIFRGTVSPPKKGPFHRIKIQHPRESFVTFLVL
jgi:hypothetical protein